MIAWPDRSLGAVVRLFSPVQDIEIYTEDKGDEKFYAKLISRLVGEDTRISRVFCLGGREAVIKSCRDYVGTGPAIFIIDGDFDILQRKPPPNLPRLHRLDAYCIENLLLCEAAVRKLLLDDTLLEQVEAENMGAFDRWLSPVLQDLIELFAAFSTALACCPAPLPNVSKKISSILQDGRSPRVDIQKLMAERDGHLAHAKCAVGDDMAVHSMWRECVAYVNSLRRPRDAISGKDYLLPLLMFHLNHLGIKIPRNVLKMRLAMNCDLQPFSRLKQDLANATAPVKVGLGNTRDG